MSEKYFFDKSLAQIKYTVNLSGLSLEKKCGLSKRLLYIFNFVMLNADALGATAWCVKGVKQGVNLTSLTYMAPCIMISWVADVKSLCLIIYETYVYEIISTLKALEKDEMKRPRAHEKDKMIEKEIKFLHLVLNVLSFCNWTLVIAFALMPLVLTILTYINTKEFKPLLPLFILYPFDAFKPHVWPFVFMRQIWTEVVAVFALASADFIFFICSTYIRIQLQLLAYEVERLVSSESNNDNFEARFKDTVKWHQKLIHAVDLLEVIYSKSTLFNFVCSSILICISGFNITTVEDTVFVVSFLSFLFLSLLQIYFLCYFGDMLMSSSAAVSDAVYNCKWYLKDTKSVKMLLIMQTRAQKPCKVTALGFADVSLMAFTKILSTAWSYFALLRTVYSSDVA